MFLSAICVLELELGTLLMERRDARQGAILRTWLEDFVLPPVREVESWLSMRRSRFDVRP